MIDRKMARFSSVVKFKRKWMSNTLENAYNQSMKTID
jgi:hypothetical protein